MKTKKNIHNLRLYHQSLQLMSSILMIIVCLLTYSLTKLEILANYLPTIIYVIGTFLYIFAVLKKQSTLLVNITFLFFTYLLLIILCLQVPIAIHCLAFIGLAVTTIFLNKYIILIYDLTFIPFYIFMHFKFQLFETEMTIAFSAMFFFCSATFYILVNNIVYLYHYLNFTKKENSDLSQKIKEDPTTCLFNKKSTENEISGYLEQTEKKSALLMIDIDNFKQINDSYGHEIGDLVILSFSQNLKNVFRETDIIGRIGGDEFAVLMKDIDKPEDVAKKAELFIKKTNYIAAHLKLDKKTSASIGIVLTTKEDLSFSDLYKKADQALYQSKQKNKNCYSFYK